MNAAARAAIQKRKQAMASSRLNSTSIDAQEVREATRLKLYELLLGTESTPHEDTKKKAREISSEIEKLLNDKSKAPSSGYKTHFRRLFASLRGKNSPFRVDLLEGKLNAKDFATKSSDELKTSQQKARDEEIQKENMRQSVGQQLLPENVNYIKDGRDREKWGVSRSAAAIDD